MTYYNFETNEPYNHQNSHTKFVGFQHIILFLFELFLPKLFVTHVDIFILNHLSQ